MLSRDARTLARARAAGKGNQGFLGIDLGLNPGLLAILGFIPISSHSWSLVQWYICGEKGNNVESSNLNAEIINGERGSYPETPTRMPSLRLCRGGIAAG